MDCLKETLVLICEYLEPFLPLVNCHTVDFIVNDSWQLQTPERIRLEVDTLGEQNVLENFYSRYHVNDVSSELINFMRKASEYTIEKYAFFVNVGQLKELRIENPTFVKISEFMTDKKLHEVEEMSDVVALLASHSRSSLVVDIGSGKGYLAAVLALHRKLRILGIDCSEVNINGATRTTMKLERKWKVYEKRSQDNYQNAKVDLSKPPKESCSNNSEYYNRYKWTSAVIGDLYKQRVQSISEETNLAAILEEEYGKEAVHNVTLTGLHTCGNLAPSCLKLFAKNRDQIKSFINVGCCYHLLEEKYAKNPNWLKRKTVETQAIGFPISNYLNGKKYRLGRDARMCGTQKPLKEFNDGELIAATKPLFYRALLQKLFVEKCTKDNFPQDMIGRIAHKCHSFTEYALKAMKKLNLHIQVEPAELHEFEILHKPYWEKLKIFFLLKVALSPVVETVILLDRLLYLHEQGITNAFVTRLFNPVISPRCYAIVSVYDYIPNFPFNLENRKK